MNLSGTQRIAAPQAAVWDGLNDPGLLKSCIPGCETMELSADNEYRLSMMAAVGPVKARFTGTMRLTDVVQPTSYSITFEGSAGVAGFGKGRAEVVLSPDGDTTILNYKTTAQVGGKLAQVGARLIDGVAAKMAETFFEKFKAAVTERSSPKVLADAPQDATVPGQNAFERTWLRRIWSALVRFFAPKPRNKST